MVGKNNQPLFTKLWIIKRTDNLGTFEKNNNNLVNFVIGHLSGAKIPETQLALVMEFCTEDEVNNFKMVA